MLTSPAVELPSSLSLSAPSPLSWKLSPAIFPATNRCVARRVVLPCRVYTTHTGNAGPPTSESACKRCIWAGQASPLELQSLHHPNGPSPTGCTGEEKRERRVKNGEHTVFQTRERRTALNTPVSQVDSTWRRSTVRTRKPCSVCLPYLPRGGGIGVDGFRGAVTGKNRRGCTKSGC